MDKEPKNYATCKEFGKMLREVANLYAKMGDMPLAEEGMEYEYISQRIGFITPKHVFEDFIFPMKDNWLLYSFDVDRAKEWGEYVLKCRAEGEEPNYEDWNTKTNNTTNQ